MKTVSEGVLVPSIEVGRPLLLQNTPEYLTDLIADILSFKTDRSVRLRVYDKTEDVGIINANEVLITVGGKLDLSGLEVRGYVRVNRVWEEGEYSVLGDVVTIWQSGSREPIRISVWGSDIESIEVINPETRLTKKSVDSIVIGSSMSKESRIARSYISNVGDDMKSAVEVIFIRSGYDSEEMASSYHLYDPGFRTIPGFNFTDGLKQLNVILKSYIGQGYKILVCGDDESGVELDVPFTIMPSVESFARGFVDSNGKRVYITESELSGSLDLGDGNGFGEIFKKIVPGDYVVHSDHGIGIFEGVVEQDGVMYLQVSYAKKDRLLIPVSQSKKIHKYVGSGKGTPVLTGLGGGVWKRIQKKARADAQRVAQDLVRISAMREMTRVEPLIRGDKEAKAVRDFASTFKYSDTEDQRVITEEIINDLSKSVPMDRLIVGDVGFGKTEMAVRAAWACVMGGKQVALLAPTTILVQQHLAVLKDRLKDSGISVESISRLSGRSEKELVLKNLKEGKVDILVGTHALLSDAVVFKDLGLLIVDEEQKFGVKQKEKIKSKRFDLHVLSMTATPIPRTLNMALKGVKEMSVLASVPPGRKPIQNYFGKFDWEVASVAIEREVSRGGQVYYVHNRVSDIEVLKQKLEERFPKLRFMVVHGQMSAAHLALSMGKFASGEVDVLVCTTIIENGIDLPNVNTLIVQGAENFGLSQLYQIRGRVGRSDAQAYACFLFNSLRGDGERRLDALKEACDLGSGFVLSNRDLEIRGVGDILGSAQSGAINSVGYAMYSDILQKAVQKLRSEKI